MGAAVAAQCAVPRIVTAESSNMSSMKKFIILPLGVALVLLMALYMVFVRPYTATPPLVMGQIQNFELTDSNNQPFTQNQLQGQVWVADFIFTSCAGVCPIMSGKMQNLYRSYEREEGVKFVSISVDPETDTPEKLTEYAKRFSADVNKWHFLTGPYEKIHELAVNSFKVGKVDEPIFHSDRFILVDKKMQIRGYYAFDDKADMKKLFHEIALVAKE